MKKKSRLLIFPLLVVLMSAPAVYADTPGATTETVTENTSEEKTEAENTEKKDEQTTEGTSEKKKEEPKEVAGDWEETEKGWMFKDKDGNYVKDTTILVEGKKYKFDKDGYWLKGKKKEPEIKKHGDNYNASSEVFLIQGNAPVERVEEAIAALNESSDEKAISNVRYMYNALTMAQKARVKNEEILYSYEKKKNVTYDYATIYTEEQGGYVVSGNSVKGTAYSYDLNSETPNLSISVQYTVDADLDGNKDIPVISMKKPDGTTLGIATNTAEIRDSNMNIKMTWADKFMQFDIASGEYGKWMIMTDQPVVFTSMPYAGSVQEIVAIPEKGEKSTEEGVEPDDGDEEEDDEESGAGPILKLLLIPVLFAGLFIFLRFNKKSGETKSKPIKAQSRTEDLDNMVQSEEDIEKIRAELKKQLNTEDYNDYRDAPRNQDKRQQPTAPPSYGEQAPPMTEKSGDSGILYQGEDDFLDDFM